MLRLRLGASEVALLPGVYDIGRARSCAIALDDSRVSRRHARVMVASGGTVTLEDLGSINGTRLNGRALAPGVREPLAAGDVIELGSHRLHVELAEPPRTRGAPVAVGRAPAVAAGAGEGAERMRSCPACRTLVPRSGRECPACGLELLAEEVEALAEYTTTRATDNRWESRSSDPQVIGVVIVTADPQLLRALRPAFTMSGDLALGAGTTLAQALADAPVKPSLVLVDERLAGEGSPLRAELVALRAEHPGAVAALFGADAETSGLRAAHEAGCQLYVKRPLSPILFVAKARLALARGLASRSTPPPE